MKPSGQTAALTFDNMGRAVTQTDSRGKKGHTAGTGGFIGQTSYNLNNQETDVFAGSVMAFAGGGSQKGSYPLG